MRAAGRVMIAVTMIGMLSGPAGTREVAAQGSGQYYGQGNYPKGKHHDAATPVRDVDTGTPFQTEFDAQFFEGADFSEPIDIPVPEGRRLRLKFITVQVRIPAGQLAVADFLTEVDGISPVHHLVMTPQGRFGALDIFAASQPVEVSADAGTAIRFSIQRSGLTGQGVALVTVSGYLVDGQ